jgi:Spy/CpxP family protein refolding chaperone
MVAGILGLSDGQVQAWITILQAREAAMQPLAAQVGQHQELLGHLLQSPTPDPATVGQVLIETRALEQQVGAIQQQAAAQFEQLLNSDQQQRLESIRQASQVCQVVPAFQAVGLL